MTSPQAASRTDPLAELRSSLIAAAAALLGTGSEPPEVKLERPRREGLGDYSTNAAMLLAPRLDTTPREVAERLVGELAGALGPDLVKAEVAGPGFVNLFLSAGWHRRALAGVIDAGDRFAAGGAAAPERVLIEFVSANPTGPLVAASGRHAAYGDALARILEHHGHPVGREYYVNDAGGQIRLLGQSVRARARGEEVPEGGYQGEYVGALAQQIPDAGEREPDELAVAAVGQLLEQIKATLERYGVHFDAFFSEQTLHQGEPSAIQRELDALEQAGHLYRSEGALWLRTTSFGDDKDRVVLRSSGEPTYLAADIAYMQNKRERGFERLLVPVASDHDTYARELRAALAALGGDPATLELPILQFVHLVHEEGVLAMSKRRGHFVTLDDLLDAIGVDATRFFMLQRSHDRTIDLDLELARRQSAENPVYYVQYAHARIASMLRRLGEERVAAALAPEALTGEGELHPAERALIQKLLALPEEIAEAADRRAPHRITGYTLELAREFTTFYEACKVIGATPEALESLRIGLSVAAQRTIALCLGLLGVSAPESM